MVNRVLPDIARARTVAGSVPDPELPMVTIGDLGILRGVVAAGETIEVGLTPTYLGCPAVAEICADVVRRLNAAGFGDVRVRTVLSPPWTTDDISADGRRKLAAAGVAPPNGARTGGPVPLTLGPPRRQVRCPRCDSPETAQTAAFGATACTALYRCGTCGEPFSYVKEI